MAIRTETKPSQKLTGFPPVVGVSPRILVLGSMPGVESLNKQQYYGHPRNQFWPIISLLFNIDLPADYWGRLKILKQNRIALWDVIHACRREGSLDSNLKDVEVNGFDHLIRKHKSIKAVFCNGQTSYKLFRKYNGHIDLPIIVLPSTSPAYTISLDEKLLAWKQILDFI